MGPTGVCSLLLELHTLCFNTLQVRYLKAILEFICSQDGGLATNPSHSAQTTLHIYLDSKLLQIPPFDDFGSQQQYTGFVPSECYLSAILNRDIEADKHDANQHMAIIAPDQIAIDDSHKVCCSMQFHLYK